MLSRNVIISLAGFCLSLIIISFLKNETRTMEKKITKYEKKINFLEKNLYESQLDFYYLSSPKRISEKITNFSQEEYTNLNFYQIYFSLEHFLNEKKNN